MVDMVTPGWLIAPNTGYPYQYHQGNMTALCGPKNPALPGKLEERVSHTGGDFYFLFFWFANEGLGTQVMSSHCRLWGHYASMVGTDLPQSSQAWQPTLLPHGGE
jgi:hypothetical protein